MNLCRRAGRFGAEEQAAVTAEFVVIFPMLLAVLVLIIFVSMFYSAASDVQQMAHDLARYSIRYLGQTPAVDLCQKLRADAVRPLRDTTLLLQPDQFKLLNCTMPQGTNGFVTITVQYDFGGSVVQAFGKTFGVNVGHITRVSHYMP